MKTSPLAFGKSFVKMMNQIHMVVNKMHMVVNMIHMVVDLTFIFFTCMEKYMIFEFYICWTLINSECFLVIYATQNKYISESLNSYSGEKTFARFFFSL